MARRVGYLFGIAVLLAAAVNLALYLFRWEWNRVLIAGLFFVAAEIALVGAALFDRMRSLEERLDATRDPAVLKALEDNSPMQKDRFEWLKSEDVNNASVFIPFLLGAGLLVSGIAWIVERVARATASPAIERGLALRLAPVTLPAGGLMGPVSPAPQAPPMSRWRRTKQIAVVAALAVIAVRGIDAFADATQTRPDTLVPGSYSLVTIDVEANGRVNGVEAARSLWVLCRGTVPNDLSGGIARLSPRHYALRFEPALGSHGERRLRGCLSDAAIDNIRGSVVGIENSGT